MIEAFKGGRGQEMALCTCDICAAEETLSAPHGHGIGAQRPLKLKVQNESLVVQRIAKMGWVQFKNKLLCKRCNEKRKEPDVAEVKTKAEAPRLPEKRQRIEIFTMLAECYDIDAGRYLNGDTDETVAEVLGVMPGWVAQIRESEFGPNGGNEDIEQLIKRLGEFESEIQEWSKKLSAEFGLATKKIKEVSDMRADLEKIKTAVGPRVMKKT